jgi:hypothetical protein
VEPGIQARPWLVIILKVSLIRFLLVSTLFVSFLDPLKGQEKNMSKFLGTLVFALLLLFMRTTTQASAAPLPTAQDDCVANGGTWTHFGGSDGENGYCYLPVGNPIPLANCNSDQYMEQYYVAGSLSFENCYGGASYVPSYGGYGGYYSFPNLNQFKHHITDDEAGELDMIKKNGEFDYTAGTCSGKCIISPSIPKAALKTLPDDATDKLYIRLVDENGNSIDGSYTVCFDLGEISNPIIYRYVGGAWIQQPISVGGGQVCTSATGDGVFALGGNTDIPEPDDQDQPAPYVYPYP